MLRRSACPCAPLIGQPSGPVSRIKWWASSSHVLRITTYPPFWNTREGDSLGGAGQSIANVLTADGPKSHRVSGAKPPAAHAKSERWKRAAAVEKMPRQSSGVLMVSGINHP